MYKALINFADASDGGHVYAVGDEYPRAGLKPAKERIAELASDKNLLGVKIIEEVKVKKATAKTVKKED